MSCPALVILGNNLVFSVATHDPSTGILTNASANPPWRLYEDETATPLLTGTMSALDGTNTTGFYTATIACTSANGFKSGKNYTIYITATVSGSKGGIAFTFNVSDKAAGAGAITFVYTLTSSADATPVANANIWVTTDTAGNNIIASGVTNAAGQVTLYLELSTGTTVYVWRSKSGWTFTNPDPEILS